MCAGVCVCVVRVPRHQFSFEYAPRPLSELPPGTLDGLSELPFQVQIRFTRRDGVKCVRCITNVQAVTDDRSVAEQNIEAPVLAQHAAQRVAVIAQQGDYRDSRVTALAYERVLGEQQHRTHAESICVTFCVFRAR